jgi:hypothetical protein
MAQPPSPRDFYAALALLHHVYFNPLIGALIRCNVPDHLDQGPMPAGELAKHSKMDELSLTRVLRALSAAGAFQEVSPGVFANNSVSDIFRDRPGGLHNVAIHYSSAHFVRSAAALGHSAVTGDSATVHVFGESAWEHMRKHPEEGDTFNRALAELRGEEHQQIADAYDWVGVSSVVDVGGGVGSLLSSILRKQQAIRGTLIEQPAVLPDAERVLSDRGVRDRCKLSAGSFFDPISAVGDVWTLCQVLHDWPDEACRTILGRRREAMREMDRLLVIEMLTVPGEPNQRVSLIDMTMLMYFGEARQRTVNEYKNLFEATQFELVRVVPTTGAFSIVEARPV